MMINGKNDWRRVVLSGCTFTCVYGLSGCVGGQEFRAVAIPGIQSGVSSILNGLVDGVFAAIEVDPNNIDATNTSNDTN